jgi:uncharacterized membrane protein
MELQTAFYIVGLVYMGVMLVLMIALLVALLAIKTKITNFHDAVNMRVAQAEKIARKVMLPLRFARHFLGH